MRSVSFNISRARCGAVAALALVVVPGFSFGAKGAEIRLPDGFATVSTRVAFTGFDGFNHGHYSGAEFRGEFARIESRLGVFDPLYVANRGRSGFTVENANGVNEITAECRAIKRTAAIKSVTLDLKKFVYSCEFGGPAAAGEMSFVIGEPKREDFKEKLLARDRRAGEASILGHDFVVNSVHDYEGSKLSSQAPLGYLLESKGLIVGAVDMLDWNPIVHVREDLSNSQRKATMIVALSLAVLRDPANSALEDL